MMYSSVILFLLGASYGVRCSSSHQDYQIEQEMENYFKRQTSDTQPCVRAKFESYMADPLCMLATDGGRVLSSSQEEINQIFEAFCKPDCQKIVLEADDECGTYMYSPGLRDFFVGLCKVNENGQYCYEHYSSASQFISDTEVSCYFSSRSTGSCSCQSELSSAAQTQGCCINVYHTYYEILFYGLSYKPRDLYMDYCSVPLPGQCDVESDQTSATDTELPKQSGGGATHTSATNIVSPQTLVILGASVAFVLFNP